MIVLVGAWVVGWIIACGLVAWANDDMGAIEYLTNFLFLAAIWPWYLYRIVAKKEDR